MKDVLETIIKNLVDNKSAVEIKEIEEDKKVTFEVKVDEKDFGKIIGKQGKVAQSIRTIMKSLSNKKVNVEFLE